MGRKRKVSVVDEEKENEDGSIGRTTIQSQNSSTATNNTTLHHGPMYTIMSNVQLNETFHKKYIKEMQQLYTKMDHDAFMFTFIKMIKTAMEADEGNDFANTTLLFCAKFVGSYNGEDTHAILVDICKWLLTTISNNPHIRFRLCQFVNMILNALGAEAALDDVICDNIMEYMLARLRDISPGVRVQAILALQRLQVPDNPDDPVLRSYQFHLCSDPSPRVRQAVITSMGRNYNTIPYILDRLWDIDEKVRRHTYLHMSSYPVRSYKVSQRLMLMEQGLNDRSEMVRKVVVNIMLQQWIESYQKNLILLVSGLKLDSNEVEIDRFSKIAKLTLKEIFKRLSKEELVACIPFEEDGEFNKCIPLEKLTIEVSLYWQCLTEYLQEESADEFDLVVPELSTFCAYVARFCQTQRDDMDKFEQMEFQYILLALVEILYTYDLGDETGRENLKKLLSTMLKTYFLEEKVISIIVKCAENLIDNQNVRLQYFVEIIQEVCDLNTKHYDLVHDRNLINELMAKSSDAALNLKLSSLKVKILDLEEQEMYFVQNKDYVNAHKITEEKNACSDEYSNLLKPLIEQHSSSDSPSLPHQQTKKAINETVLKCLQVAFHMVVSDNVQSLTPNVCKLYNDFICRHIASNQIAIRDWALKCGTAYSMLYESLAKDVFGELFSQFYKNHNIRIWKTSIGGIFELLDRYGMDNLVVQEQANKSKKTGRQLYNTLEFLDVEEESGTSGIGQGVDIVFMMSHFLDTCDDVCIMSAIVKGFCRLILRGHIKSVEIIEKLLLRYFNPSTDDEVNQILGVFLENLIQRKMQDLLYPCLLPTVTTVLSAPYDSPLQEIKPEKIVRFITDATRQEFCMSNARIHNKLAEIFLQEMQGSVDNKDLCKLLAKEIITLELNVADNELLKKDMKVTAEQLINCDFDPRTIKSLIVFKDMLDGKINPAMQTVNPDGTDEEDKSDDENVASIDTENTESGGLINGTLEKESNSTSNGVRSTPSTPLTSASVLACASAPAPASASPSKAANAISPSAAVPTTYGRENRVGQRYLRKSLNTSCRNSAEEPAEGPSRPAKIRIEARIDSDKKMPKGKGQRLVEEGKKSRARRNLRGCERSADDDDQEIANKSATDKRPQGSTKSKESVVAKPKQKTPEKQQRNKEERVKRQEVKKVASLRRSERTNGKKVRNLATKEKVQAKVTPMDQAAEEEVISEESSDAEVIPPSPPVAEEAEQSSMRLRRMRACRQASMRSEGNAAAERMPAATSSSKAYTNNNSKGPPAGNDSEHNPVSPASTPLRNGRKRVFHDSPTASLSSDISNRSPARKQTRMELSEKLLSVNNRSSKRAQNTEPKSPASKTINVQGSPSSSKENEEASAKATQTNSPLKRVKDKERHGHGAVPHNISYKKLPKDKVNLLKVSKQKQPVDNSLDHGLNTMCTRNSARKDRQPRTTRMTCKHLSLEKQSRTTRTNEQTTKSAGKPSAVERASKIPLRLTRLKKPAVSMSAATSETNFRSRPETAAVAATATSSPSKKTITSSLMKKNNFTKNKTGKIPLPARLVLARRAAASADKAPTSKIVRRSQT